MSRHHQQQSKMSSIVEFSSPSSGGKPTKSKPTKSKPTKSKPTKKKPQHHSDSEECLMKDQLKERSFNKCFKTDENDEETALCTPPHPLLFMMHILIMLPWILKGVNSQISYEFICKGNTNTISTCVQWDDSTSILHTHVMNCIHGKQRAKPETQTMIDYVSEDQ
ncbi:hypothetical protein M422DRAFT_267213 [Sphaerobolus stellatus SS14]|uniref:Uncharacterized protein n=1 Tax=Sphaerobolus stellatus (strain SS14) TaxID=990650 RepID=A0A0C9TME2_SPHS4|nr:hypothetical protein M422DRAFT_267213 [Sphaerobolus stellatus SS14]